MNSIESVTVAPARVFKALSSDDLRRCAPSVFAEHARPGVSARYTFVSTAQVVALLGAGPPDWLARNRIALSKWCPKRCRACSYQRIPIHAQQPLTSHC